MKKMKIFVTAKPGARKNHVKKLNETRYAVSVTEPPERGRANKAIIIALGDFFGVGVSRITIRSGHAAKHKIIEIAV